MRVIVKHPPIVGERARVEDGRFYRYGIIRVIGCDGLLLDLPEEAGEPASVPWAYVAFVGRAV